MTSDYDEKYLLRVGNKIAARRQSNGQKIEELARAVSVSKKVISQIENGRYLPLKVILLLKIWKHLLIPLNELITGNEVT